MSPADKPHDVAGHQRFEGNLEKVARFGADSRASRSRSSSPWRANGAAASLERCSWMKAVPIASITITAITIAARMSPRK